MTLALTCIAAHAGGADSAAPPPPPPLPRSHTVVLPEAEFARVLERVGSGIYLSHDEFLKLWREATAKARERSARQAPDPAAGFEAAVSSATFEGRVDAGRIALRVTLGLASTERGWQLVPLPLAALALGDAKLDGADAPLTRLEDGTPAVLVRGAGAHALVIEGSVPARETGPWGEAVLEVPDLAVTGLALTLSGRATVSATPAAGVALETGTAETRAVITPAGPGPMRITWRRIAGAAGSDEATTAAVFQAAAETVLDFSDGIARLTTKIHLDVFRGALDSLRVALGPEGTPTRVVHPALAGFTVEPAGPTGERTLVVRFREPVRGESDLKLGLLVRVAAAPFEAAFRAPTVPSAARFSGRLSLVHPVDRSVTVREARGLEPAPAPVEGVERAFAYRDSEHRLALAVARPDHEVEAQGATLLTLGEARAEVRHHLVLTAPGKDVFSVILEVPHELFISAVSGGFTEDGTSGPLTRRVPLVWREVPGAQGTPRRIEVDLGAELGGRVVVELALEGDVPFAPPEGEAAAQIAVPRIVPVGHEISQGRIVVLGAGLWRAVVHDPRGLVPASPDEALAERYAIAARWAAPLEPLAAGELLLALRWVDRDHGASLEVRPAATELTARSTALYVVEERRVEVHAELGFTVRGGGVRELSFRLPYGTGERVGIEGVAAREKVLASSTPEGGDVWVLRLADRVRGPARVLVDFDRALEKPGARNELSLPEVVPLGVARLESYVVIEGSDEMDVAVANPSALAELDLAQLPAGEPRPRGRLLALYRAFAHPTGLRLTAAPLVDRPVLGAAIERLTLETQLADDGVVLTRARVALRNAALQFLPVTLPEDSSLWSASVAGIGVKPARAGGALLVPLDAAGAASGDSVEVVLDYRTPGSWTRFVAGLGLEAPGFPGIPVGATDWTVIVPAALEVLGTGGNATPAVAAAARPPGWWRKVAAIDPLTTLLAPIAPAKRAFKARVERDEEPRAIVGERLRTLGYLGDDTSAAPAAPQAAQDEPGADQPAQKEQAGEHVAPPKPTPQVKERATGLKSMNLVPVREGATETFRRIEGDARVRLFLLDTVVARVIRDLAFLLAAGAVLAAVLRGGARPLFVVLALLAMCAFAPRLVGAWIGLLTDPAAKGVLLAAVMLTAHAVWRRLDVRLVRSTAAAASAVLLATALLACGAPAAQAQERPGDVPVASEELPKVTVYVPYPKGKPSTVRPDSRVFLPTGDFQALWTSAHGGDPGSEAAPPVAALLTSATYQGAVRGDVATLTAELTIHVLADGWVSLPLPFGDGVAVGAARWLEEPEKSATLDSRSGVPTAVVRGPGRYLLALELAAQVEAEKGGASHGGSLALALPPAPASHLALTLPAPGLEVDLGAGRHARAVRAAGGTTVVEADLGPERPVVLSWHSAGVAGEGERAALGVVSEAIYDLDRDDAVVRLALDVTPSGAAAREIRLAVPAALSPIRIEGAQVADWDVVDEQVVRVRLAAPTNEPFRVTARFLWRYASRGRPGRWPHVRVLDVSRVVAGLSLAPADGLVLVQASTAADRGDPEVGIGSKGLVRRAVPTLAPELDPHGRRVAASFTVADPDFGLDVELREVEPVVAVVSSTTHRAGGATLQSETALAVHVSRNGIFALRAEVAGEGTIESVDLEAVERAAEGVSAAGPVQLSWQIEERDRKDAAGRPLRIVAIGFSQPLLGAATVRLKMSRRTPDLARGAAEAAQGIDLDVPAVRVLGVQHEAGRVVVLATPEWEVGEAAAEELAPAETAFEDVEVPAGYRFARGYARTAAAGDGAPSRLTLHLTSAPTRFDATVVHHVLAREAGIEVKALVALSIQGGGVERVRLGVPAGVGASLRVEDGAGARRVRETVRVGGDAHPADDRELWDVVLHARTSGALSFVASWNLPLERAGTGATEAVAEVRGISVEGAAGERTWVLVENASAGETRVVEASSLGSAVADQVPFLPSEYREDRSVRVARAESVAWRARVVVAALESAEVVRALVDYVELTSTVTDSGLVRTRAVYRVQNRTEPALRIRLPRGAELWGATVAGRPVKPASDGTDPRVVVIPILKTSLGDLPFDVTLVYRERLASLSLLGSRTLRAPEVLDVPVAKTLWSMWLPRERGYSWWWSNVDEVVSAEAKREKLLSRLEEATRVGAELSRSAGRADLVYQRLNWEVANELDGRLLDDIEREARSDSYLQEKGIAGGKAEKYREMQLGTLRELGNARAQLDQNLALQQRLRGVEGQRADADTSAAATTEGLAKDWKTNVKAPAESKQNSLESKTGEEVAKKADRSQQLASQQKVQKAKVQDYLASELGAVAELDAAAGPAPRQEPGFAAAAATSAAAPVPAARTAEPQSPPAPSEAAQGGAGPERGSYERLTAETHKAGLLSLDVSFPTEGNPFTFKRLASGAVVRFQYTRAGVFGWLGRAMGLALLVALAWTVDRYPVFKSSFAWLGAHPAVAAIVVLACGFAWLSISRLFGWAVLFAFGALLARARRERRERRAALA